MSTLPNRALPWVVVVALIVGAGSLAANQAFRAAETREHAEALTGGNVDRGRQTFIAVECGGCHTATGAARADGLVGPPLGGIAERAVIAGKLANNPANLERWISSPQSVVPGNAMPRLGGHAGTGAGHCRVPVHPNLISARVNSLSPCVTDTADYVTAGFRAPELTECSFPITVEA